MASMSLSLSCDTSSQETKNIIGILGYIYRHVLPPSTYTGDFVDNGCAILLERIITRVR